jgi:hypothetical protein
MQDIDEREDWEFDPERVDELEKNTDEEDRLWSIHARIGIYWAIGSSVVICVVICAAVWFFHWPSSHAASEIMVWVIALAAARIALCLLESRMHLTYVALNEFRIRSRRIERRLAEVDRRLKAMAHE